jgi:hypothetical protein
MLTVQSVNPLTISDGSKTYNGSLFINKSGEKGFTQEKDLVGQILNVTEWNVDYYLL